MKFKNVSLLLVFISFSNCVYAENFIVIPNSKEKLRGYEVSISDVIEGQSDATILFNYKTNFNFDPSIYTLNKVLINCKEKTFKYMGGEVIPKSSYSLSLQSHFEPWKEFRKIEPQSDFMLIYSEACPNFLK
ncbi:hypothetical protein J0904_02000 [Acinetobacter bereziniae]|jgi:hypothetical protein|uniref:hypothetical protein n=1 Tax=Acinetobacter bereziniae TaxID=106648 RepID=UPI00207646E0|nr:hypothetical protein [Acinetobacter bereziniae]MCM8510861.1 hypothetical protein [Acinetobacter bereziniae]